MEAEFEASPFEGLRLTASGAYLDTEYVGLRTADPIYLELGVRDLTGNKLAGAPKWQYNLGAEYKCEVGQWNAELSASCAWNGRVSLDIYNNPGFFQDSVGVLNLSASLTDQNQDWKLTVFGTNLTNELYTTNAVGADFGGGGFIRLTSFGDTRRYGVRIRRRSCFLPGRL